MDSNIAFFRFYEELNDFLPQDRRKKSFPYPFRGNPSVKDAIEALGIPHVEVDLILVNGQSTDFNHRLQNGESVSVYPAFESFDISGLTRLRNNPLRVTKFIADVHLGKLARHLRLCGFDTYFRADCTDPEIINISLSEKRIILTRDKGLLKNKHVTHGYWIRSVSHKEQLKEIFLRFDLKARLNPFTRCMECNTILSEAVKDELTDRLLPNTRLYYHKFKECPGCHRIYWNGSHYERMKKNIDELSGI
jgi:uncharacterized protein with PIN domain